jgi:hypothetical protein
MRYEVQRIGIFSAAKMAAGLYFVIMLFYAVVFLGLLALGVGFAELDAGQKLNLGQGLLFIGVLMPILAAIGGFIGGAIMALIYNFVAGLLGGVELEMYDQDKIGRNALPDTIVPPNPYQQMPMQQMPMQQMPMQQVPQATMMPQARPAPPQYRPPGPTPPPPPPPPRR